MGTIGRRAVLTLGVLAALAAPALAEVHVSQSVDRTEVGSDDTFDVTVTVSGLEQSAELALPRSRDLEIVGRSQSTQMSYSTSINGNVTTDRQQTIALTMHANRTGTITVPGAVVTSGGATFSAEPLQVRVQPGHIAAPRGRTPNATPNATNDPFAALGFGRMADPFGDEDEDPFANFGHQSRLSPSDVQLVATLDHPTVYAGQQATLKVWLLTRVGVSVAGLQLPKIDGALLQDIETPKKPKEELRTFNGQQYHAFLVAEKALFPLRAGSVAIGAAEVDVTANGLFQSAHLTPKSSPLTLTVRPVPPGGPVGEAIGHWTLAAEATTHEATVGAPITLRVTAEGEGDLKGLALPRPEPLDGLTSYEPSISDEPRISHDVVGGRRVEEIVLVPTRAGDYTLPPLALPYFDPKTGEHRVSRTQPIELHVAPGASPALVAAAAATPPAVTSDGIHPLRDPVRLTAPPPAPWHRATFWLLIAIPALLFAATGLWARHRARAADGPSARQQLRVARRHLAAAERLRDRPLERGAEIERGVSALLAARLGRDVRGLPREALERELARLDVAAPARARLLDALELSRSVRFSPTAHSTTVAPASLDRALALAHQALDAINERRAA